MRQLFTVTGVITGFVGVLLCAISGLARVSGLYYLAGYESTAIFTAGIGVMVFSCLVRLYLIAPEGYRGP